MVRRTLRQSVSVILMTELGFSSKEGNTGSQTEGATFSGAKSVGGGVHKLQVVQDRDQGE